jgi:hypothetical protein
MARHLLDASRIPSRHHARLVLLLPSHKALRLSKNVTQRLCLGLRSNRLLLFHLRGYVLAAGPGLEWQSVCLVKRTRGSTTSHWLRMFGTLLRLWYAMNQSGSFDQSL